MRTSYVRRFHANEILHAIRREPGISQRDIVRRTGFDKSTVSSIVSRFDAMGLVLRTAGKAASRPGRPTEELSISPRSGLLVGVQVEAGELGFMAAGLDGIPLAHHRESFDGSIGALERQAGSGVDRLVSQVAQGVPVLGIGVSLPGLVSREGVLVHAPVLGWRDVPVADRLRPALKTPVYVGNDGKAAAMAEHMFGESVDAKDFLYLFSGSGVGGALMLDGEIYGGAMGFAGELGHVKVVPHGRLCSCGALGCLSAYLSESALASEIARASDAHVHSFDDVLNRADRGESIVLAVFDQAAAILGSAVASLINIFNPPVVVLGGDLARAERFLRPTFERAWRRLAHPSMYAQSSIRFSTLSAEQPYLGGIALALDGVTGLDSSGVLP